MSRTLSKVATMTEELILTIQDNDDDEGTISLEWDRTHPRAIELGINDWTEEQWIECLRESALATLDENSDGGDFESE